MKDYKYPGTDVSLAYCYATTLTFRDRSLGVSMYFVPGMELAVIPHMVNDFTKAPEAEPAYSLKERAAFYKASREGIRNVPREVQIDALKVDQISTDFAIAYGGDANNRFIGRLFEDGVINIIKDSFATKYQKEKGFSFDDALAYCKSSIPTPTEGDE